MNASNSNVLTGVASSEDSTRLVGTSDSEESSGIVRRVSLGSEYLVSSGEEDSVREREFGSWAELYDGSSSSIVESCVDLDIGSGRVETGRGRGGNRSVGSVLTLDERFRFNGSLEELIHIDDRI